jgi:hypothetical protein
LGVDGFHDYCIAAARRGEPSGGLPSSKPRDHDGTNNAAAGVALPARRTAKNPTPAKPRIISAQDDGSGTGDATVALPLVSEMVLPLFELTTTEPIEPPL